MGRADAAAVVVATGAGSFSASDFLSSGTGCGGGGEVEAAGVCSGRTAAGSARVHAPTTAAEAPPPISGGTLLVTRDGTRAVASDPDRDLVYIVDLAKNQVRATVTLAKGDEPG